MKQLIRAGFCLVLLLIVLLVLVALQHVLEKKQPDKKDSTETVTESMDGRADDATEAVLETETEAKQRPRHLRRKRKQRSRSPAW